MPCSLRGLHCLGGLIGSVVQYPTRPGGLNRHHCDFVGHNVVKLAGDPGSFLNDRLGSTLLALEFGPDCARFQGDHPLLTMVSLPSDQQRKAEERNLAYERQQFHVVHEDPDESPQKDDVDGDTADKQ